jgi:SmpA / OmlA family.
LDNKSRRKAFDRFDFAVDQQGCYNLAKAFKMRRIRQIGSVFLASLTLLSASCVTGEKMSSLSPGMTKDQVISLLGHPDGYQAEGDSEVLRYTNKLVSGFSWDRADYYAILRGGKLVEYGAGQVRQDQNHKFILVKTL